MHFIKQHGEELIAYFLVIAYISPSDWLAIYILFRLFISISPDPGSLLFIITKEWSKYSRWAKLITCSSECHTWVQKVDDAHVKWCFLQSLTPGEEALHTWVIQPELSGLGGQAVDPKFRCKTCFMSLLWVWDPWARSQTPSLSPDFPSQYVLKNFCSGK